MVDQAHIWPKRKQHKIWLDQYFHNCLILNKSEHTLKNYKADLHKFFTWYENNHLGLIHQANGDTISHYQNFLSKGGKVLAKVPLKQKMGLGIKRLINMAIFKKVEKSLPQIVLDQGPLSVTSRRRHLSSVKNFFEFLKQNYEDKNKIFQHNPVKSKIHGIRLKEIDVEHTEILRTRDWQKLQEVITNSTDRAMVHLLYFGGLRLQELSQLKWEDCNFDKYKIYIERKGGYRQTLELDNGRKVFNQLQYIKRQKGFIFSYDGNHPYTTKTLYNRIMKLFKKAQVNPDLTPHSFRKACATNIYLKTKDLIYTRDYLGHHDAKVTQTYIDPETVHGVAPKLMELKENIL
ncbi:MAG: tyrosine-type recombinase/integrase [Bacteriovoracaceae bacterium]